ncbi:hypothetical protein MRB53_042286 [Persea americana]|nr:hypothetical protein MRB53_042286 [Persea americana]
MFAGREDLKRLKKEEEEKPKVRRSGKTQNQRNRIANPHISNHLLSAVSTSSQSSFPAAKRLNSQAPRSLKTTPNPRTVPQDDFLTVQTQSTVFTSSQRASSVYVSNMTSVNASLIYIPPLPLRFTQCTPFCGTCLLRDRAMGKVPARLEVRLIEAVISLPPRLSFSGCRAPATRWTRHFALDNWLPVAEVSRCSILHPRASIHAEFPRGPLDRDRTHCMSSSSSHANIFCDSSNLGSPLSPPLPQAKVHDELVLSTPTRIATPQVATSRTRQRSAMHRPENTLLFYWTTIRHYDPRSGKAPGRSAMNKDACLARRGSLTDQGFTHARISRSEIEGGQS